MMKVFGMFDEEKTGFVETSKFVDILNTLGQTFDEEALKTNIAKFDPESKCLYLKEDFNLFCFRFKTN